MLISAAVRCFVMQRFVRMCYADATNRVLKEQSMVVRRTEKRDFGLATGWSEEDGTTTTYQPIARNLGSHRRIETGPVPRNVQPRTAAPASLYARRPSGVQPKVATPALDDYEVLELDELDLSGNPFAPRRSAASASVWNVLGFAALFASVLIGRAIVDAGQSHARTGAKDARGVEAPPPSAAAATGSAGVGPDAQRNAAALDPDLAARDGAPAPTDANPAAAAVASTKPDVPTDTTKPASATDAAKDAAPSASDGSAKPAVTAGFEGSAQPGSRSTSAGNAKRGDNTATDAPPRTSAGNVTAHPPGGAAPPGSAADSQPTAAEPSSRARSGHASPARSSQARESSDWRDGPMEPATTNAQVKASDWRDGPMEPATTNARTPSNDWREGPIEPATNSAPPTAAPAPAGKAAPGTLRINSRPWSQVFIDGRLIGNTPQMAVSVPAGRYTVRLSNPELGMSKTITIQVAAGELVTRIETLE